MLQHIASYLFEKPTLLGSRDSRIHKNINSSKQQDNKSFETEPLAATSSRLVVGSTQRWASSWRKVEKIYCWIDFNAPYHGQRSEIPNYRENSPRISTSDTICSNGTRKESTKYTGDEIAGIVVTHKSNLMPIRKDNKQAAVDAASMRR